MRIAQLKASQDTDLLVVISTAAGIKQVTKGAGTQLRATLQLMPYNAVF